MLVQTQDGRQEPREAQLPSPRGCARLAFGACRAGLVPSRCPGRAQLQPLPLSCCGEGGVELYPKYGREVSSAPVAALWRVGLGSWGCSLLPLFEGKEESGEVEMEVVSCSRG